MAKYRITYRHEINISAKTKEEAQSIWENIDLGNLNKEVANNKIDSHDFIVGMSFEDEDYNDVNLNQNKDESNG